MRIRFLLHCHGFVIAAAVNGERFELRRDGGDPGESLLEFLRSRTCFPGAKLGCGEGKATPTISPSSSAALLPFDRLRRASLMVGAGVRGGGLV
uniref:Uncharacterized protein n=1 Tax=Oryza glumipatula TaxID=40148 RepID=A0A0D9ZFA8_9ORYZ